LHHLLWAASDAQAVPEESRGGPINYSDADWAIWFRRIALLPVQNPSIVGAAGSEAARTALAVWDFLAVYQLVAVFDLLRMVAATVRARGHLSPVELHIHYCTLGIWHPGCDEGAMVIPTT
jgi:hypothetical protein